MLVWFVENRNARSKKSNSTYDRHTSYEIDDTSSTTTESSVETNSNSLDSSDHGASVGKSKKMKAKTPRKRDLTNNLQEDDYISGSKSKMHKKLDSHIGGNILKPRYMAVNTSVYELTITLLRTFSLMFFTQNDSKHCFYVICYFDI